MDVFVFDLTNRKIIDEKGFRKIVKDYPNDNLFLVTEKQKERIETFGRNSIKKGQGIRWIDASDVKLVRGKSIKYNQKTRNNDILVFDFATGPYLITAARELENLKHGSVAQRPEHLALN